ncbi:metallophosphoesterase family protein [Pedobacter sp. GR22-6]|uniref:metallophosphoesterase family protein n=1 Tax=Pedobacter sp. GR22-6 TaxID=3127957 RepID=UPI00307F87F3
MKTIGLISDTHGFLDDAVYKHFEDCDEVWHAGDFGPDVAEKLSAFKPLRGVYGNIDGKEIRSVYPEHLRFSCENLDVWITHIGGYPGKYAPNIKSEIYTKPPKLFISGHSHILKVMYDKKIDCMHINPGAAGNSGWHRIKTLIKFCVTGEKIHNLVAIEIGNR